MAKRDELSALAGPEPDFGFFELDADEIDIEINQEDMNLIDIAGSLRVVADELKDESEDDSLSTTREGRDAGLAIAVFYQGMHTNETSRIETLERQKFAGTGIAIENIGDDINVLTAQTRMENPPVSRRSTRLSFHTAQPQARSNCAHTAGES